MGEDNSESASTLDHDITPLIWYLRFIGPRVDWDPDIVAMLDSDNEDVVVVTGDDEMDIDETDDILTDDFITLAKQDTGAEETDHNASRQRQWLSEQMVSG